MTLRLSLALLILFAVAGCGGPRRVAVRGIAPLNVNEAQESTPVNVRFYQLARAERFRAASFEALWTADADTLGDERRGEPVVITVFPSEPGAEPRRVELGKLDPQTRFIGVMALYRQSGGEDARTAVVPVEELDGSLVELSGSRVQIVRR